MPSMLPRRFTDPYMTDPLSDIRRELDQVFERFLGEGFAPMLRSLSSDALNPQLDVKMEGDQLQLEMDLPGVNPDDVEIMLQEGMLTIKGERREEHKEDNGGTHLKERRFGRFERRIRLPDSIDDNSMQAHFDKGVLTISAHVKKGVEQQKRIQIAGATGNKAPAKSSQQSRGGSGRPAEEATKKEAGH